VKNSEMTIKIGLTGNYLSGLDYITAIFKRYKIPVYDCDIIIKYFLYNSEEHIERVRKSIGDKYFKDGVLDISSMSGTDKSGVSIFYKVLNILKYDIIKAFELWRKKYNNNTEKVL
jgi:dephospho-CoA kinase